MVENTSKIAMRLFLVFIVTGSIIFIHSAINGADQKKKGIQQLDYLPTDERFDFYSKDYTNLSISETGCNCGATNLFQKAADCLYCIKILKPRCPDCCLILSAQRSGRKVRCRKEEDSRYDCPESKLFSPDSCSNLNCVPSGTDLCCGNSRQYACSAGVPVNEGTIDDPCQARGCTGFLEAALQPSAQPDASPNCWGSGDTWYCFDEYTELKKFHCPFNSAIPSCQELDKHPHDIDKYYKKITRQNSCEVIPPDFDYAPRCYKYEVSNDFKQCIGDCKQKTASLQQCDARRYCCEQQQCGGKYITQCAYPDCLERLDAMECDSYQDSTCISLMHSAVDSLLTDCSSCLKEIDPNFVYRFVAKSNETLMINWKINTANVSSIQIPGISLREYLEGAPAYLFTMVKVVDASGNEVHRSMMHQKHFQSNFSIDSATVVTSKELVPGNVYFIRLYYFIPSLTGVTIGASIDYMHFLVVSVREEFTRQ